MSDARNAILRDIRHAVGERAATASDEYAAIRREYRDTLALGRDAVIDLLVSRLEHYDSKVYRCSAPDLRETIAAALAGRNKHRLVMPPGVPRDWLPAGVEFIADVDLSYADLDAADGVLTGCTAAIAFTGSIVLCHTALEGRRALSLVPDYHLCVVGTDQIFDTVPAAVRHVHTLRPLAVTTISGPSATADIEMTRIRGVHGPRTLDVILWN
jgi:L-lactate dehydrogenase complex protein LldG